MFTLASPSALPSCASAPGTSSRTTVSSMAMAFTPGRAQGLLRAGARSSASHRDGCLRIPDLPPAAACDPWIEIVALDADPHRAAFHLLPVKIRTQEVVEAMRSAPRPRKEAHR